MAKEAKSSFEKSNFNVPAKSVINASCNITENKTESNNKELSDLEDLENTFVEPEKNCNLSSEEAILMSTDHNYIGPCFTTGFGRNMAAQTQIRYEQCGSKSGKDNKCDMFTKQVLKEDSSVHFYTGFPNAELLLAISKILNPVVNKMKYYSGSKKDTANSCMYLADKNKPGPSRKLPAFHDFFLTLMKLRSDLPQQFFCRYIRNFNQYCI